jgi:uncharacterized membrane protein YkvA (DUF1232 family)
MASKAIVPRGLVGSSPTPGTAHQYAASVSAGLIVLVVALALYGALVLTLVVAGRKGDARALVRLVPDCVVLFKRLLTDPRVDWWRKAVLVLVIAYIASPIDLVPDFVPIAGQLDDAIVVVLAIRLLLRGGGPRLLSEHWPGPARSLEFIRRLAY